MTSVLGRIKKAVFSQEENIFQIKYGPFCDIRLHGIPAENAQVMFGLWERETYAFIKSISGSTSWVVDVGAGRGELILYFALKTMSAPLYAIDANSFEIEKLLNNLRLNGVDESRVFTLCEFMGKDAVTLDSLRLVGHRGFLKIDVEGAELQVLESGLKMLETLKPRILLETHSAELERECLSLLKFFGYGIRVIKNAKWRWVLPEQRPTTHNRWLSAVND